MTVSVLRLPVRKGAEQAVIRFYEDRGIFGIVAKDGGFQRGALLRPDEPGAPFLVVAEWDDEDAYARWLAAPARDALSGELQELLDGDPSGSTYSVVNHG